MGLTLNCECGNSEHVENNMGNFMIDLSETDGYVIYIKCLECGKETKFGINIWNFM